MEGDPSGPHGIRWGIGIGLLYCGLLTLRFYIGSRFPGLGNILVAISFLPIAVLLFFCGKTYRTRSGGYAEMKDLFKTMFIAVLVFEAFFSSFSLVYLRYIDLSFFKRLQVNTEQLLLLSGETQPTIKLAMKGIDNWEAQTKTLNVFDILKSYLYHVAMVGLFALLFAFILKRKPSTNQTFPQA